MRCTMEMELKTAKEKKKDEKIKTDNSSNNGDDDQEQKHFFLNITNSVDRNLVARVCIPVCVCAVCLEDTILDQNS